MKTPFHLQNNTLPSNSDDAWSVSSWRSKKVEQPVDYEDQVALKEAISKLQHLPPLVTPPKVFELKEKLKKCANGEAFLLQGGDCAELFKYCTKEKIEDKLKVLLQMSLVIILNAKVPVVRVARIAGQYAKPRSQLYETVDGVEYNTFRGDCVNSVKLDQRKPDPKRLLEAYFHSSATLNYMTSILHTGFADLRNSAHWKIGHINDKEHRDEYENIISQVSNALGIMDLIGITNESKNEYYARAIKEAEVYSSHEAMLLEYESALTRKIEKMDGEEALYYDGSAHFVWVGDRTRQLDGAHIEYLSGICNPIGIKAGPTTDVEELIKVIKKLNKTNEVGKITLITRFGANLVEGKLPVLINAIKASGLSVVWVCDPMHGNTETVTDETGVNSFKTRRFDNIFSELNQSFKIHQENGSKLNGVHFELTGDNVTECLGGLGDLKDLRPNYETLCDPRLNYEQSMDVAFLISKYFKENTDYYGKSNNQFQ